MTRMWHITIGGDPEAAVKFGLTLKAKCGAVFSPVLFGNPKSNPEIPDCDVCHSNEPSRVPDLPHYVYRCYDDAGQLVYVGCSALPRQRMEQHKGSSWWFPQVVKIRYAVFPNKEYALWKEREAIGQENPRWNIKGRDQDLFDLADYRDLHCTMAQNGASATRLEAVRAKALLRFSVDITEPLEAVS